MLAHGFKSGTRLAINASPELVSNIAASVTEDIAVLGGLALMSVNPILAAVFFLTFLAISAYLTPKLFRRIKGFFWLVANKFVSFFSKPDEERLLHGGLTSSENQKLGKLLGRKPEPLWSARVLVGRCKKFPQFTPATFGRLITEEHDLGSLHFVGKRFWKLYHTELVLDGLEITHEPRFFSEDVVLYDLAGNRKLVLKLPAGHRAMATRVVESLIASRDRGITTMPSDRLMMA